ncbi:hypothetical protein OIU19_24295 [Pseudomonas sp. BT-42-2]|uniref:hypothetical protein n=1 Tax=Pseudomonas sp. BT-42-2 TaxID=2986927 RepID=UPI0021F77E60|nr:hypothetical protein [Pseudomonas sp. BT-42-2]MCV9921894.1 hypothetical protein [Pseudomonas sp. BT-42-2]
MSIPSEYRDIVFGLLTATNESRVNWYIDRHDVQVKLQDTIVKLWSGTDEQTEVPFVSFALSDLKGKLIDTWFLDEGNDEYDHVFRLYTEARRKALGIPQKLEKLRAQLKSGGTIGASPINAPEDDEVPF